MTAMGRLAHDSGQRALFAPMIHSGPNRLGQDFVTGPHAIHPLGEDHIKRCAQSMQMLRRISATKPLGNTRCV